LTVQNLLQPQAREGADIQEEGFRQRKDIFKRRFSYYHWEKLSPFGRNFSPTPNKGYEMEDTHIQQGLRFFNSTSLLEIAQWLRSHTQGILTPNL